MRLVLADDQPIVLEGIAAFCGMRPEITVLAKCVDGEEALEKILLENPEFAVLALHLPKLSGLEVVKRVRQANCPTKLIILAGSRDEAVVRELFDSGADGFVLKDEPARHLFDAMAIVGEGHRYLNPPVETPGSDRKPDVPDIDPATHLSKREYAVFLLLVEGMRPKDIAKNLEISPKTVDTYRANILRKLEVEGIAGLVRFAIARKAGSGTLTP